MRKKTLYLFECRGCGGIYDKNKEFVTRDGIIELLKSVDNVDIDRDGGFCDSCSDDLEPDPAIIIYKDA